MVAQKKNDSWRPLLCCKKVFRELFSLSPQFVSFLYPSHFSFSSSQSICRIFFLPTYFSVEQCKESWEMEIVRRERECKKRGWGWSDRLRTCSLKWYLLQSLRKSNLNQVYILLKERTSFPLCISFSSFIPSFLTFLKALLKGGTDQHSKFLLTISCLLGRSSLTSLTSSPSLITFPEESSRKYLGEICFPFMKETKMPVRGIRSHASSEYMNRSVWPKHLAKKVA